MDNIGLERDGEEEEEEAAALDNPGRVQADNYVSIDDHVNLIEEDDEFGGHDDDDVESQRPVVEQQQQSRQRNVSSVTDKAHQITFSWENITVQTKGENGSTNGSSPTDERTSIFSRRRSSGASSVGSSGSTKASKTLLLNVCGFVRPGELVAIMGASGAGKSTLLNTLTFKNLKGLQVTSGQRYANGHPVTPNALTSVSAYVQQDDLFIGTLTVREQLVFQAMVRMESHLPRQYRLQRVDAVIQELGLSKCSNTLIGVPSRGIKGISGGELKRLAFACEVLTNPSLFFCDEPTSGLDSYMAQNVVQVLRNLSKQGKTILCTIHQPSSQVFELFDRVLLMAQGRLAFLGAAELANTFFETVGFPCPINYNPADHYVHVLAVNPGKEEACSKRVNQICDAFEESEYGHEMQEAIQHQISHASATTDFLSFASPDDDLRRTKKRKKTSPYRAKWCEQFTSVLWRSFLSVIKEPLLVRIRLFQSMLMALILGVVYLDQDYQSQEGVMNINGALFVMMTNMTFQNVFAVVQVFSSERPIFLREHYNGMYRTDVYYLSKQLAELPTFLAIPTLYVIIFYWMVGLHPDVDRFFVCLAIMILMVQVVVSFGYLISCAAPTCEAALALAPPLTLPLMIFGGFFLNSTSIPYWLRWLKYLSWFHYGNELLLINQWRNVTMNCDDVYNGTLCNYKTGEEVIAFYGYSEDNFMFDLSMMVGLAVALRFFGFLFLLARTIRKSK